jgi:hypothetical protein
MSTPLPHYSANLEAGFKGLGTHVNIRCYLCISWLVEGGGDDFTSTKKFGLPCCMKIFRKLAEVKQESLVLQGISLAS